MNGKILFYTNVFLQTPETAKRFKLKEHKVS